jgi:hypothetical protein
LYFKERTTKERIKARQTKYSAKSKRENRAHNGATFPSLGVCNKLKMKMKVMMVPENNLAVTLEIVVLLA